MVIRLVLLLSICVFMTSCSTSINQHAITSPGLIVEDFFDGKLTAHGVVMNTSGKVIRSFNADINAYWEKGIGVLEETFTFDDGEEQIRIWKLKPIEDKNGLRRFIGTAGDVVEPAEISVKGNAMFLKYTLQVPFRGKQINLVVDDKMFKISDSVIINESKLRKFGLPVGKIILTIIKHD